jgi:predicted amidophosphoribosyltransferase
MIEPDEWPKCPVCQARFRDANICSRCGADLEPLMFLIANAYQLRQDARRALQAGDFERAQKLASEAQATCSIRRGANLWLLSRWLLSFSTGA